MKVFAILAAAGTGTRFSSRNTLPKQFLKLKNKPVILYSLLALQKCKAVDYIIVSANKKHFSLIKELADKSRIRKLTGLTGGGKTRFESVRNAFMSIKGKAGDLVVIHDAVRPAVNVASLSKIINAARGEDTVIYGIKVYDTIKKEIAGYVSETADRKHLWLIQTPQVFKYAALSSSYKKNKGKISFTDEAALAEKAGYKVKIIEGERRNIKITTTEDLDILKELID
jgi:2-C-methyl-D-erythritol 4-phosphate cytidylyltransferase